MPPARADTAIFYSITNTLYGLRGISFGNFLIKQVVDDLAHDLPNLKQFATLSPMPGLRAWLEDEPGRLARRRQRRPLLAAVPAAADAPPRSPIPPGCTIGLVTACSKSRWPGRPPGTCRQDPGSPIDPVGRFHLGNGARIERLNWLADRSPRRLAQSAGLMVNYLLRSAGDRAEPRGLRQRPADHRRASHL